MELLQDQGLSIVDPSDFWIQQGTYRSRYWDLARWGADWNVPSKTPGCSPLIYSVFSWDRMKDCVRYGITIEQDGPLRWEVHANSPSSTPPVE